jgi:hypothetical protein
MHRNPYIHSPTPLKRRIFPCRACGQTTMRQQELDRHYQMFHLPYCVFCPLPGCRWRGDRVGEFNKHWGIHQYDQRPSEEQYQIYNVKMVLDWIKESQGGDIISVAQNFAVDLVKERALELGRQDWLEDPWGRLGRQSRRGGAELRR